MRNVSVNCTFKLFINYVTTHLRHSKTQFLKQQKPIFNRFVLFSHLSKFQIFYIYVFIYHFYLHNRLQLPTYYLLIYFKKNIIEIVSVKIIALLIYENVLNHVKNNTYIFRFFVGELVLVLE